MLSKARVTFVGSAGNFSYRRGVSEYEFIPGENQYVPVAIAIAISGKKDKEGNPLFEVEKLPHIVRRSGAKEGRRLRQLQI